MDRINITLPTRPALQSESCAAPSGAGTASAKRAFCTPPPSAASLPVNRPRRRSLARRARRLLTAAAAEPQPPTWRRARGWPSRRCRRLTPILRKLLTDREEIRDAANPALYAKAVGKPLVGIDVVGPAPTDSVANPAGQDPIQLPGRKGLDRLRGIVLDEVDPAGRVVGRKLRNGHQCEGDRINFLADEPVEPARPTE